MKYIILICITLIYPLQLIAGNSSQIHYSLLQARFEPEQAFMSGLCRVRVLHEPGSKNHFYLHGELRVDSIMAHSEKLPFSQHQVYYDYEYSLIANRVEVHPDSTCRDANWVIYYHGYFNPSRARSPSDYMRIDSRDGVLLRSYGYSLWFPIFLDDGADAGNAVFDSVQIDVPENLHPVVAGERLHEWSASGRRISLWRPGQINLFDLQCTARPYRIIEKPGLKIYSLEDEQSAKGAEAIASFSKQIDAYYRSHYRNTETEHPLFILEMPHFGNISSGNVIGIATDLWRTFDEQLFPKIVLAHEQVHPFVQSNVSTANPLYALIIEGFPSYFHLSALGSMSGEEWYREKMDKIERAYLTRRQKAGRDGALTEKPILELTADDISLYKDNFVLNDRVLLFLNHLRATMGVDKFDRFCLELFALASPEYGNLERLVLKYAPGYRNNLMVWLKTTEFPESFRIQAFRK